MTASALERPSVSIPSTTSLARPDPVNSGYVRDFAWRASRKAAPAVWRWCLRGWPAAVKGETNVVSTASCEPFHKGRPLAMTSMRLSSCWAVCVCVEVSDEDVCADCGPCFSAHACRCSFHAEGTGPEGSGSRACCPVVSEGIQRLPASAHGWGEGEWKPKATEQKDTEVTGFENELRVGWEDCENFGCLWSRLRVEQGL